MDPLDVHGGVDARFGAVAQPENPVVDFRIEEGERSLQRAALAAERELAAGIEGPALLGPQVGVAARLEVEVVERGVAVVAGCRGLQHDVAPLRGEPVDEERRDERRRAVAVELLAQVQRHAQPRHGTPLDGGEARQLEARAVVELADILARRVVDEREVAAVDHVLRGGDVEREEPLAAQRIFGPGTGEERVHVAARVGHREEIALAFGVLQPLVAQVCVGVARPRIELQPVCEPFPADGGTQRPLVLQVLFRLLVVAVRAEQRQPPVRIQIPCRHREAAAVAEGVVELLQQVDVAECPVAVAAERIAGADDVAVGVGLELLGVVVAVAEVVLGGAAQHACRGTPAAPPVAQLVKEPMPWM